jgi:hypothetical protein
MHALVSSQSLEWSHDTVQKPPGNDPLGPRQRSSHSDDSSQRAPTERDTSELWQAAIASTKIGQRTAANLPRRRRARQLVWSN